MKANWKNLTLNLEAIKAEKLALAKYQTNYSQINYALIAQIDSLLERIADGERSAKLYNEIMGLKIY